VRSDAALVLKADVDTALDQVLNHFKPSVSNRVVDGSLAIIVDDLSICSVLHQLFSCHNIAFSDAVKYRGLTVCVEMVYV
jgi:hypothetical protein